MSAIAIIPARGGSRRIPRKNIKPFMGIPMLAYSVRAAQASHLFRDVWVSTEDPEVGLTAVALGALIHKRDPLMAEDGVGTQEVVREALLDLFGKVERVPPLVCCIYPCAPLLLASDLITASAELAKHPASRYAVCEGIFYFGRAESFLNSEPISSDGQLTVHFDMGYRGIDINTPQDWAEAEAAHRRMHG